MPKGASKGRAVLSPLLWVVLVACGDAPDAGLEAGASSGFVGAAACAECHPRETEAWSGSHHDRAMQEAIAGVVLGDFDDVTFEHRGETTRFFRRGDGHFVETRGPDGALAEYEIEYAFGVEPLQQYLVGLPEGRLQALTVAWDARPSGEGGQRWFSLHPDEDIPPGDVLHWSGAGNRWNTMCAHCHSTNLRKGYDLESDRYDTTWSDIDVACEACHGPGADHLAWVEAGADAGEPSGLVRDLSPSTARWVMDDARGIARRDPPRVSHTEIETCAPCHSRRSLLSEDGFDGGFLDAHRPALLDDGLYFADGQIHDEVYVYGSFLQSRMFAQGVSCGDCHEPHSLALRGTTESVCAQCHDPARFATEAHHHHAPETPAARCVSCHMPSRTYMEIDDRRDHSFRIPRPDLSERLGAPDACDTCHADRGSRWAAEAVRTWRGDGAPPPRHFGEALAAGRDGVSGADRLLRALVADEEAPAIARATALMELAALGGPTVRTAIEESGRDAEGLLRMATARAAESRPPPERIAFLRPLLKDPSRAVRIEAARALAEVPISQWSPEDRRALERALDEYRAVQRLDADQPQAHVNLGLLHLARGEAEQAEAAYRRALTVGDYFVPAYVNLADLHRAQGRDDEAEPLLRRAVELAPESAMAQQALGLLLVRLRRPDEALTALGTSARLAPEQSRFAYVYGVALTSVGRTDEALAVWSGALRRHPHDAQLLVALVTTHRDAGNFGRALRHGRTLDSLQPGDEALGRLLAELEQACAAAGDCPE